MLCSIYCGFPPGFLLMWIFGVVWVVYYLRWCGWTGWDVFFSPSQPTSNFFRPTQMSSALLFCCFAVRCTGFNQFASCLIAFSKSDEANSCAPSILIRSTLSLCFLWFSTRFLKDLIHSRDSLACGSTSVHVCTIINKLLIVSGSCWNRRSISRSHGTSLST